MDLGAGRRGVDMGASALRNAHLSAALRALGHQVSDLGDVPVTIPETHDKFEDQGLIFLDEILSACTRAYQQLRDLDADTFPIALGGDHSVSMGTVAGAGRGRRTGLSGSTPTPTSTRPAAARAATFTACRWPT